MSTDTDPLAGFDMDSLGGAAEAVETDSAPALVVEQSADTGVCKNCGNTTYRPDGVSPTGRKLRIPKFCDTCKSTGAVKTSNTTGSRKTSRPDIEAGMTDVYTTIGLALLPVDQELAVKVIGYDRLMAIVGEGEGPPASMAESAGKAWAHVAATNPNVAAYLEKGLKTSVWAELIQAHLPMVAHVIQKKPKIPLMTKLKMRRGARRAAKRATTNDE